MYMWGCGVPRPLPLVGVELTSLLRLFARGCLVVSQAVSRSLRHEQFPHSHASLPVGWCRPEEAGPLRLHLQTVAHTRGLQPTVLRSLQQGARVL